jgi:hypothetical protein
MGHGIEGTVHRNKNGTKNRPFLNALNMTAVMERESERKNAMTWGIKNI